MRNNLLGGTATWQNHGNDQAIQAFGKRAIMRWDNADEWMVTILLWRDGQWTEIDSDCGPSQEWAVDYSESAVFALAKEWQGCEPL